MEVRVVHIPEIASPPDRMRNFFRLSAQLGIGLNLQLHSDSKAAILQVLNRLAQHIGADRCALIQLDGDEALPVELEYTSGPDVFPYKGLVPPWGLCPFLRQTACKEFAYTTDALKDLSVQAIPQLYQFFKEKGVRGGIGCPVMFDGHLRSVLVVHTVEPREWQFEELALTLIAAEKIGAILLLSEGQKSA